MKKNDINLSKMNKDIITSFYYNLLIEDMKDGKDFDIYDNINDLLNKDSEMNKHYVERGLDDYVTIVLDSHGNQVKPRKISKNTLNNSQNIKLFGDYLFNQLWYDVDDDDPENFDDMYNFIHFLSELRPDVYNYMETKGYIDYLYGITV